MRKTNLEWFIFTTNVEGVWHDIEMDPIPHESFAERKLAVWRKENPGIYAVLKRTDPPRGRLVSRPGRLKYSMPKSPRR
jgi:hypothetical protein